MHYFARSHESSFNKFDNRYLINLFSFEILIRTWGLPLKWLFHVPFWMTLAKGSIWTTLFKAYLKGIWTSGLLTRQNIFSRAWQTPSGSGQFVNARFPRFTNSNLKLRLRLSLDWGFSISLTSFARPKNLGHPPLGVCQALEKTYFLLTMMQKRWESLKKNICYHVSLWVTS